MRVIDKDLRQTPWINGVWLRAWKKARAAWGRLSLYQEHPQAFNKEDLRKAEELLTEALQTLANAGLDNSELASMIRKTLEEVE